ncbi:DnaJ domain-containing protein [Streptosporangium canum]|uniref:DnaJ domain-containing protein n=1 Tax=Streptosporangium canum TaxID=324952 RepID=UPI003686826B
MFSAADLKPCKGTRGKLPCGKNVRWTRTVSSDKFPSVEFPVDPAPHLDGDMAVWRDVHGVLRSRQITTDRPLVPPEKRMMPHIVTCAGRPRVQPPPPPPPRPPRTPKASPSAGELYDLLDVPRTASQDDIKRAYRKLARQYHPDVNSDPEAVWKFKAIGEAYHVLSDPGRRATYNLTGRAPRAR